MPKISICIPSYNHGNYITHTLNSILDQSFQDFEIIISDDNSKDNTLEIIKNFKDPRIKIIENKRNQGPSINTNIAINHANSNLIALIASDDMMERTRLEKTFNFLASNPEIDAVFTHVQTIDVNNSPIDHKMMKAFNQSFDSRYEILNYFFYKGNFLCAPSCLIKKDILISIGGLNPCLLQLQDFDAWIKILIKGYNIGFIEQKLTYYRIGDNLSNISNTKSNSNFFSRIHFETTKILENFLKIKNIEELKQIFPNAKDDVNTDKKTYLPFFLLQEALKNSRRSNSIIDNCYKNFAIKIAYDLLMNEESRNEIYQNFNFQASDFFNLTSENPLIDKYCELSLGKKCKKKYKEVIKVISNVLKNQKMKSEYQK